MLRAHRITIMGLAIAALLSVIPTGAFAAGGANCVSKSAGEIDHDGADGSHCTADATGQNSKAIANAKGNGSSAISTVEDGGQGNAIASGASDAQTSVAGPCKAKASAKNSSDALGVCGAPGASAQANANKNSTATADASAKCKAKANATNDGSADADCNVDGGFAIVTATNGGSAVGSDTSLPTCSPNGGTAKVRSSGGNCGP